MSTLLCALLSSVLISVQTFDTSTCGTAKSCFVSEENGLAVSLALNGDALTIELLNPTILGEKSYVAVGFSDDDKMRNEPVIECSVLDSFNGARGRASWDPPDETTNVRIANWTEDLNSKYIQTISTSNSDTGGLSCQLVVKVNKENVTAAVGADFLPYLFFPNMSATYYLLIASGLTDGTDLQAHHRGHDSVSPAVSFQTTFNFGPTGAPATAGSVPASQSTQATDNPQTTTSSPTNRLVHALLMEIVILGFASMCS